jgi:hypothetical protein
VNQQHQHPVKPSRSGEFWPFAAPAATINVNLVANALKLD